jgi:hypothetical protein
VAGDGSGDALTDADAVLAGFGKRGRKDVVVRGCSVKLKRGDDRAVEAYLVGLDGSQDDALDQRGGLELVGKPSSHGRMIVGVADGFMAGTVMLSGAAAAGPSVSPSRRVVKRVAGHLEHEGESFGQGVELVWGEQQGWGRGIGGLRRSSRCRSAAVSIRWAICSS